MKRALLIAAIVAAPSVARAFPTGLQFDNDPMNTGMEGDGAGGIPFTGAPRWAGHTCEVCHTNPARTIGLRLEADHPEIFTTGWKPKTTYHLRVIMAGEHAGAAYKKNGDMCGAKFDPYVPCDENGFAIEMDDPQGAPAGKLGAFANGACVTTGTPPPDADTRVMKDGTAATHTGAHMGQVTWDLCWTSPDAGTRTITAYVTAVDGNGGDGTIDFPNDTAGDDVAAGAVPLPEAGAPAPDPQTGGCSATDAGGGLLVIAILLALRARRALALALALLSASCVHVRPHQRETLAERKMKVSPDPSEDELDLHMQESREGSSGGYGSAGGGCGCN